MVVGAGIAGLAAAHSLEALGYQVRVLERDLELRTEGAGSRSGLMRSAR